jgi:hypothetical protein
MKALKRTMAGEYSRELGVKVLAGQRRLANLGFKQGGSPGYGLRRVLVSATGTPKQELARGERKSIATDRVILAPGPEQDVRVVRDIFSMLVSGRLSVSAIAGELNRMDIRYSDTSTWDYQAVYAVLTSPKYMGCNVFGRTSSTLSTPTVRLPKSEWVFTPGAFQPIVDAQTFLDAQKILQIRTINKSNDDLLDSLRTLLASKGRLSLSLIKNSLEVPSPSTYRHRFGSLRRAYELIGYGHPDQFGPIDLRRRTQTMRDNLVAQLAAMFSAEVSIARRGGRCRSRLRLRNGLMVSVLVARSVKSWKDTVRWQIDPVQHERRCVTLLARLDRENRSFLDFHVLPSIDRPRRFHIRMSDAWLNRGVRLRDLSSFCTAVTSTRRKAHGQQTKNFPNLP